MDTKRMIGELVWMVNKRLAEVAQSEASGDLRLASRVERSAKVIAELGFAMRVRGYREVVRRKINKNGGGWITIGCKNTIGRMELEVSNKAPVEVLWVPCANRSPFGFAVMYREVGIKAHTSGSGQTTDSWLESWSGVRTKGIPLELIKLNSGASCCSTLAEWCVKASSCAHLIRLTLQACYAMAERSK